MHKYTNSDETYLQKQIKQKMISSTTKTFKTYDTNNVKHIKTIMQLYRHIQRYTKPYINISNTYNSDSHQICYTIHSRFASNKLISNWCLNSYLIFVGTAPLWCCALAEREERPEGAELDVGRPSWLPTDLE